MKTAHLLNAICTLVCMVVAAETSELPAPQNSLNGTKTTDVTSAIQTDARLDRRVNLDEIGISISDLVGKLGGASIKLTSADECANQKLQMHLRNRSVREVMESISALLPGYWIGTPSGYMLRMKVSVVSQRKDWWEHFTLQREAALAARNEITLNSMRSAPSKPDPNHPSAEIGVDKGYRAASDAAEVYNVLPADLQDRIANQVNDMNQYTNYFAGNTTEGAVVTPITSLPSAVQD